MYSIDPADGLADAHQQLAAIREDPRIKGFALQRAGHPDLADDALQSAYYAMARLENLEQIENLRAYFCKVLIRAMHRERGQLGAALVDDFARVAESRQGAVGCDPASSPCVETAVCTSLQAKSWLERIADNRDCLLATIPARFDDPHRYRGVIYAAADQVLRDSINAEPSDADTNEAFRAAYPEYFDQSAASPNTLHQRFRRARKDVKALLQAVIRRDELT